MRCGSSQETDYIRGKEGILKESLVLLTCSKPAEPASPDWAITMKSCTLALLSPTYDDSLPVQVFRSLFTNDKSLKLLQTCIDSPFTFTEQINEGMEFQCTCINVLTDLGREWLG
jgi:hypothetical protein